MKKLLPLVLSLAAIVPNMMAQTSSAQVFRIAKDRLLFHDQVDKEQLRLLQLDGQKDGNISFSKDETINQQIEYALINKVDDWQVAIERDSTLNHSGKIKYLRVMEYMVRSYNNNFKKKDFPPTLAPSLMNAFAKAMELDRKNESIAPVVAQNSYGVGRILSESFVFPENIGLSNCKTILLEKYLDLHPNEILPVLRNNPDVPFAETMLIRAAKNDLRKFYDYAAVRDRLGNKIRSISDPYVSTVSKMASSRSGQQYFPFIDLLLKGKITFEEIDRVKDDDLNYYRLLVKTRVDYAERMMAPAFDTALETKALTERLGKKAKEYFIREINGLHDNPNEAIRFKVLEPLTPQELYYLCVTGEDEIYTSSYLGVFKRIFQRMKVPRGDSLLMSVNGDYFRKFIKLAAAYNTLDTLLKSMPEDRATSLMQAFMLGLEKTTHIDNVEDAVDVADSYSSIFDKNKKLAAEMLELANWNYQRCVNKGDKNGQIVYRLEKTLFESADTTKKINLSDELGIPPVYSVDYRSLADDSGRVVQQVFFYGDEDKDGQMSFANFMSMFKGKADWSISENPWWVSIKSAKGKPVWIFANKPLYGEDDPDAEAQEKLNAYLSANKIKPTVFIHRGHSYHVKYSLAQIQPSARIVILGSCGGYNNLNDVLTISSDAHIISSKQVGTKVVNEPILESINSYLRNGRNIDWLLMWKDLSKKFGGDSKEKFDDYIPPYKNLGAIFIKAYKKALPSDSSL